MTPTDILLAVLTVALLAWLVGALWAKRRER